MAKSPFLKPNRLADIIDAIQFMAMHERSSLPPADWADGISGDREKARQWEAIFLDHPEFFRPSPNNKGYYALIWRRALPRLYFRSESRLITPAELAALPPEQHGKVSRPPVTEQQVKNLIDIAIELHEKARQQHADWRWWVPIVASFAGSLVAVLLGIAFGEAGACCAPASAFDNRDLIVTADPKPKARYLQLAHRSGHVRRNLSDLRKNDATRHARAPL